MKIFEIENVDDGYNFSKKQKGIESVDNVKSTDSLEIKKPAWVDEEDTKIK